MLKEINYKTKLDFLLDHYWDEFYDAILAPAAENGENTDDVLDGILNNLEEDRNAEDISDLFDEIAKKSQNLMMESGIIPYVIPTKKENKNVI